MFQLLFCFRSIKGLQDWLFYLTYATQARYASAFLSRQVFLSSNTLDDLPYDSKINCTNVNLIETFNSLNDPYCKYANGNAFLTGRYSRETRDVIFNGILDLEKNIGITFAFTLGVITFNLLLYMIPMPAFLKAKFRE